MHSNQFEVIWNLILIGITNLWFKHVEYAIILDRKIHYSALTLNDAKPFNIYDVKSAFYILFIGMLFSTIIFVGELIIHKRNEVPPFQFVH